MYNLYVYVYVYVYNDNDRNKIYTYIYLYTLSPLSTIIYFAIMPFQSYEMRTFITNISTIPRRS